MTSLSLRNVSKFYGKTNVLNGIDLEIASGEFVVFVGPSGCGKSTLLRMICGLEEIDGGELLMDGQRVNQLSPRERGVAMVFQSYALYPHMTVYRNIAFGLQLRGFAKAEVDRKVRDVAATLQLTDYLDRLPRALSGGQRQRVAIGRALVREPRVFLLDEPLSNLDAALRVKTRIEFSNLHHRLKSTMLYVTHDQVEAMTLGEKIVLLHQARVQQVGTAADLYWAPQNRFVATFIGSPTMNVLSAKVVALGARGVTLERADGERFFAAVEGEGLEPGQVVEFGVRPEHLGPQVAALAGEEMGGRLRGQVDLVEFLGESKLAYFSVPSGEQVVTRMTGEHGVAAKTNIEVACLARHIHVFRQDGVACRRLAPGFYSPGN